MKKRLAVWMVTVMVAVTMMPAGVFADDSLQNAEAGVEMMQSGADGTGLDAPEEATRSEQTMLSAQNADGGETPADPANNDVAGETGDPEAGEETDPAGGEPAVDLEGDSWKEWSEDGSAYHSTKDGKWYSASDKLLSGIVTIDGNTFYFKSGAKVKGFRKAGKYRYYFKSDYTMARGPIRISGKPYFFDRSTGRAKAKGVFRDGSDYYRSVGNGKLKTGWELRKHKKIYYYGKNGKRMKGLHRIGKKYYFFNEKNGKVKGKGLFRSKSGKVYYCKGGGKLATGWKAVGKRAYYFYKSGKTKACSAARDTTIGHLYIPKKGYLGYAYALGIRKLNKTKWTLKQAFRNSASMRYYDHNYKRDTSEQYAIRGFEHNHGNCYVMAATFYIQAKLLGYDVHQVKGLVSGRFPHSWTVIKQKGKEWVYDPNFSNETNRSGWKIYYGKKGTWRYGHYKKMN